MDLPEQFTPYGRDGMLDLEAFRGLLATWCVVAYLSCCWPRGMGWS
jgi:hypothetical protein